MKHDLTGEADYLGLRRGTVELRSHAHAWLKLGKTECATVRSMLGELVVDVQHVGGTAIAGLPAKPILDIAAALASGADPQEVQGRLTVNNEYEFRGDKGAEGGLLFVRTHEGVRTVHVHVVAERSREWSQYILLRDYLRKDPGRRAAYARLKTELAARFPENRASYTAGKDGFIQETLALAAYSAKVHRSLDTGPREGLSSIFLT